jgi:hypothetical protein
MQSQSIKEARWWCTQGGESEMRLARHDVLSYGRRKEYTFRIKNPPEHRRIVALAHDILTIQSQRGFSGGLVWFHAWEFGSPELVKPGWKIIESMRRAQGDPRCLDIAPGQVFREDELVELHAFLIQMMAFGWSGYYVPSAEDFFLDFRTSERFFCVAKSEERLRLLSSSLKPWKPASEIPRFPKAMTKREAAAQKPVL